MIKFQQSQALTSHFESFWSIVQGENGVSFLLKNRLECLRETPTDNLKSYLKQPLVILDQLVNDENLSAPKHIEQILGTRTGQYLERIEMRQNNSIYDFTTGFTAEREGLQTPKTLAKVANLRGT